MRSNYSAKIKCEPSSDSKSAPSCTSRCQICPFIEETNTFQNKDKSETFDIKKGFWTVVPIWLFKWLSVNHVLSSMWVVLLHRSVAILIIIKAGLQKCQKFIPRNDMSIKNNFIVTLTLRDTMGWRSGRLLSLIGLKRF